MVRSPTRNRVEPTSRIKLVPEQVGDHVIPVAGSPDGSEFEYDLAWVPYSEMFVDYAPPYGSGYARPLSEARLAYLRKKWKPQAMGEFKVSDRGELSQPRYALLDGNHRKTVHSERGGKGNAAIIYKGLTRVQEADVYLAYADTFAQSRMARFLAKLNKGIHDPNDAEGQTAVTIEKTIRALGMEIDYSNSHAPGTIRAVETLEAIRHRGTAHVLYMVLWILRDAFGKDYRAFQTQPLEGTFQFWIRYWSYFSGTEGHKRRCRLIEVLQKKGVVALGHQAQDIARVHNRRRSVSWGEAIRDTYNLGLRSQRERLPEWPERFSDPLYGSKIAAERRERINKELDRMMAEENLKLPEVTELASDSAKEAVLPHQYVA